MEYIKLATGQMGANSYIIYVDGSKEAAIVDPGDDGDRLLEILKSGGFDLRYILLTHGHGDHIGAVKKIKESYPASLIMAHRDEEELLGDPDLNLSKMIFNKEIRVEVDRFIEDGDIISLGGEDIRVIHTPGHSPGGVCYLVGKLLFTGDTLFQSSIGRSDFYKGNELELLKSIRSKIMILDNDIVILPGHGQNSTIEKERIGNPYI